MGGEAFPPDLAAQLSETVGGVVTNMFGPTETTIWSSTAHVKHHSDTEPRALIDNAFVSIGKPLCNQSMYVLDEYLQPVPPLSLIHI